MSTPPTHSHGSSASGQLPVMLGRKPESRGGEVEKKRTWRRNDTRATELGDIKQREESRRTTRLATIFKSEATSQEPVFGRVYIALHLTRGIEHADVRTKESFYIIGNRKEVEALNAVWMSKEHLATLCKDVNRLGAKLHLFEDEPYALCKKEKYFPLCMCIVSCALIVAATASSILEWDDGKAALEIATGLMLSLTIMCCFCLNFRRRKILDWEVPLAELEHFAQEWGEKHDLKLHFEFKRCGPSFLVLMPRRLPDARRRSDDSESSEEEFEEDVLSPSAKRPPKAEFFRPRVMNEPPV